MKKNSLYILIGLVLLLSGCSQDQDLPVAESQPVVSSEDKVEVQDQDREQEGDLISQVAYKLEEVKDDEEAKIDLYLRKFHGDDLVWEKAWKELYLTELDPYSDLVHQGGRIYIEVYSYLYVLDEETGEEVFQAQRVGAGQKPFVDPEGNIYCIGYYGPFATKVLANGDVAWQLDYLEDYYWPSDFYFDGPFMYISCEPEEGAWVNTLQVDCETGQVFNAYWNEPGMTLFEGVLASSQLDQYPVTNVIDYDGKTGWVAGGTASGIGESITFRHHEAKTISKIVILNGYHKSKDLYYANNRPESLEIEFSDGEVISYTCEDVMKPLEITFERPIDTQSLEIRIKSVKKGSKYDDTVISGIYLY